MERTTAKVFMCGTSQAVRIPQEFRFQTAEVTIVRQGDSLLLTPKSPTTPWSEFFKEPICEDFDLSDAKFSDFPKKELF